MKKQNKFRRIIVLLLAVLLAIPMNLGVFADEDGPSVLVSTSTRYVKAGSTFTVSAAFDGPVQSNAVTLRYRFDGEKFEYVNFAFAGGSVVDTRQDEGSFRVSLMIPNYNAESLGELTLKVKDGAALQREMQRVDLAVEYVLKDEEDKTIRTAESFASFTTLNGTGPEVEGDTNGDGLVDIVDLSNIIDWFGENEGAELWPDLYIWFDFNGDHEIDIYDIAYLARLIGSGQTPVSKAALKILIDKAEALEAAKYTAESWAGLAAALANAIDVYEDADAVQAEITGAYKALRDALNALVPVEPDTVDKTALGSLIERAGALVEAEYTAESWAGLATALTNAIDVYEDADATQAEVDAAAAALQAAIDALVSSMSGAVDKSVLESLIAGAEALEEADYTSESWAVLQEALDAAKAVAADEDATQGEVNEAADALRDAMEALELASGGDLIPVESIKINSAATSEVRKNKTLQLGVILTPANANFGTEITWASSNEAAVTVSENGLLTGIKAGGSARITATSSNGKTYTITVTVTS